jgi:hypothetical protein
MKIKLIFVSIFVLMQLVIIAQNQSFRIVTSQSAIQYLKKESSGATTIIRNVMVKIEYWSDKKNGNIDKKFTFSVATATAASASAPAINMQETVIPKDSFDTEHKTISLPVFVTVTAVNNYSPEFFTIGLKGSDGNLIDASAAGVYGVTIQKDATNEKILPTPDGFSLVNAVNFDFDGNTGSSYVGNFNLFKPAGFFKPVSIKKPRLGYNLGIMKINFSKNDSLNASYNYAENTLIRPLDSIKIGSKFLRQYNKLSTVSKNLTWSFYFQPTVSLVYNSELKVLFHVHTELYVDKWTTNTTISNYQQDTSVANAGNLGTLIFDTINKFSRSLTDNITSTSTSSTLNFNFGFGITIEKSWEGGSLFIQPTLGWAFDYARPQSVNTSKLNYNLPKRENVFAHLTRFRLSQHLTTNVEAIIGIDVRGRFGRTPTYAAFLGANLGLEGIRKLVKL